MNTTKVRYIRSGFLVFLWAVGSAIGQSNTPSVFDLSLDELLTLKVSVASRRDEIVRDAPAVMTIVTRSEIESLGARNLMDIINRLPSMQIVGHAGFYGNKTQIRAQPNSSQDRHTLILLNGRPVRENINGGNNAYFYLGFPVSAIESIEIIRGPGSVLYGSNAFAAVINIKTRRVSSETPKYEVGITYGTYDTVDGQALVMGSTSNHVEYLGVVRVSRSEGPRLTWTDNSGIPGSERYSDDSDAVYVRMGGEMVSLQAAYHRYVPGTFGVLGALTDAVYISEVETFFADAGISYALSDELTANLNITFNTFDWYGSNDGEVFFERRNSENVILEPMFQYVPLKGLNLLLGGTLEYDKFGGRELFGRSRYIRSVYGQADYQLTDWLKPLVGLQYNKTEEVDANYSPRFGVVLTPGKNWGMKLLYSEAFRRAFAAEGYLDSAFLLGNTELEPETIETYEAQINYQSHICQVDLTYFYSRQDVIEVDFSRRPLQFINQPGNVETEGIELAGRVNLGRHWQALGSTIVQDTKNNTPEPFMYPNYPDYMIKGGFMGRYGNVKIGLFNSYLSEGSIWHERSNNLQANVSFDISQLLRLPQGRMRFALFADNLLDEKLFQKESDTGLNEPIPHTYGRRLYASLQADW